MTRLPARFAAIVAAALLACLLGPVGSGTAYAQYPPTVGTGRVTRSTVAKCQCTVFQGDGFAPHSTVTVTDDGRVVATVRANGAGRFSVRVCWDERSSEGQHALRASGTNPSGGPHEARSVVTVRGDVCFRPGDEVHDDRFIRSPNTGAVATVPALLLGAGLVISGAGVLLLVRRRRVAVPH